jgi:murein DD-endopeptidase MepM/ murein hydrolase activator NlpD
VFVGKYQYGGKYIDIDRGGGLKTRYLHLSTFAVSVGNVVNDDTKIGERGSTGLSTGPHLHFEVWQNGVRQNPRNYLSF